MRFCEDGRVDYDIIHVFLRGSQCYSWFFDVIYHCWRGEGLFRRVSIGKGYCLCLSHFYRFVFRHVACPPFDWEEDEDNLDQFKADHSELMKRPDPFGQKIVVEERTVLKTSFSSLDKTAQFYKAEHSGAILLKPEGIRGGIGKFAAHPEASQGPRRQNENHESAFSRQQQIPQNPGSAFSRRFEPQNAFQPLRDATHNGQSQNEFSQISNRQQQGSSKMPQRRIGASKLNQMKPGSSRASFHRIPHPQEGFFRPDDHEKERALLDEPYPKLPARGEKVVKRPRVPGVKSMFHRENEHNRQNPLRPSK